MMPRSAHPSRARYVLVLWLCGLSSVLYLDRICMSQAVPAIKSEFNLNNEQISYALMAFTLAYGLFEIPTGRLGDRFGSRNVLTRIVVWWSAFTALTGASTGLLMLIAIRFLFGAGEAGAFPNAARVIARWLPTQERGRVQGLMLASAQIGAVAAPTAAAYLIEFIGWRWAFAVFGVIGILWAIGFWWWFRDEPAQHSSVNAAELELIQSGTTPQDTDPGPIPWRAILRNRGILVLSSMMICGAFYTYFFYSWFPTYLTAARGLENLQAGRIASFVLAGSALGMLVGGWLADQLPRWANEPLRARRALSTGCFVIAAACLFIGVRCDHPLTLAALWGASFCTMHITLPNWWSVAIPQCGRHIGTIFGLMNGMGVLGALASQWFVGWHADWRHRQGFTGREQWDPLFDVYVIVLVLGGLAWWLYRVYPLESGGHTVNRAENPRGSHQP